MSTDRGNQYWMAFAVSAGAVAIILASLLHIRGTMPKLASISENSGPVLDFVAPEKVQRWFDPAELARLAVSTNPVNPFFTRHFEPPPKAPPPPPPSTRQASLLYQGSLRTSQERLLAYLLVEDKLLILTNGSPVIADHAIARITLQQVILTNTAGETNVLTFRVPAQVQVPVAR
ncbi:MAG: hypothetical protein H7A45_02530 [Verrucomicrobiales bacterium]|nr:hypothetical protein [Verrucomicrobiales bacterium]MCP5526459.1 hypothetical protein [Verrucomicrobiales bacterium]